MFKYIGSSWLLTILQIVVMMKLTPFTLNTLGKQPYGVWLEVVALTGLLKLLIAGVPMASVRFIAEAVGKGDEDALRRVVSTCVAMCAGLGLLALLIGGGLYLFFSGVYLRADDIVALGPEVLTSARLAYLVVVASVAAGFVGRLPYGILEAHHDFLHRNAIMAGELVLRLGLTILLLSMDADLKWLAGVQVTSMVLEFVVALAVVKHRHPGIQFGLRHFDRARLRPILGFSLYAMLLNVGAMLAFRIDALVVGASSLGATGVTAYDNGNKFFEHLIALVLGIGMVVMPTATKMKARGDITELGEVLFKWSKVALSLALCVGLFLLVLGPEFLSWWLKEDYESRSGVVTQILVVSFFVFLPVRGVALPILMGLGLPGRPALALLGMGLLNLALSLALVEPYGVVGVALGTAIPNVLFAAFVLGVTCRELGLGVASYLTHVAGRALAGSLAPIAWLCFAKWGLHVEGLVPVFGAGFVMVLVFGLTWVLFVYRDDPHFNPRAMIAAKLGRGDGS